MKKIIIFTMSLLFLGCSFEKTLDRMTNVTVWEHIEKTENKFNTFTTAGYWIAENIEYVIPSPYVWKSPSQTEKEMSGMCVDTSLLLLWYAIKEFDYSYQDSYLCGVKLPDGSKHMMVYIDGWLIETQTFDFYNLSDFNVVKTYNLEEALDVVYYQYGNRKASDEDIWD